jgi:histone deacetylase 1/2
MTVSFHKFGGGFFPGTGSLHNVGAGRGTHYSLNAPLRAGVDDAAYASLFDPVITAVMEKFRPEAVVLQCGADSLAGDRLGVFNLTSAGHRAAVKHVRSFGLPTLVLGGGGYKIANVARCWAAETGALCGVGPEDRGGMADALPDHEFSEAYSPSFRLAVPPRPGLVNANPPDYIDRLRVALLEHVARVGGAPGVEFAERADDWGGGGHAVVGGGGNGVEDDDGDGGAPTSGRLWDGKGDPDEEAAERAGRG